MSTSTNSLSVSVLAGPIELADRPADPKVGQMVLMGFSGFYFHITPEIAKQWVPVLEQIAGEK
jgi:hypothetical protein